MLDGEVAALRPIATDPAGDSDPDATLLERPLITRIRGCVGWHFCLRGLQAAPVALALARDA